MCTLFSQVKCPSLIVLSRITLDDRSRISFMPAIQIFQVFFILEKCIWPWKWFKKNPEICADCHHSQKITCWDTVTLISMIAFLYLSCVNMEYSCFWLYAAWRSSSGRSGRLRFQCMMNSPIPATQTKAQTAAPYEVYFLVAIHPHPKIWCCLSPSYFWAF